MPDMLTRPAGAMENLRQTSSCLAVDVVVAQPVARSAAVMHSSTKRKLDTNISAVADYYHFANAAVAVDCSRMTASSSAAWSRFSPPWNVVNGHVSTMWFVVCRWPQSHEGDWVRPHLCKLTLHGPRPARKRFIRDHVWRGRWKPGCRIVGSVTVVWLTTEADDQSSLHCCGRWIRAMESCCRQRWTIN